MTLVYRDESFDYSNLEPDMVAEVKEPTYQSYVPLRLLRREGSPRGFVVGESEDIKEAMENLSGYFWASGSSYDWGGGGVYRSTLVGHAEFPVLATTEEGGVCTVPGLGSGERVVSDSYSAPHDDNETDAQFNARYGYVHSDGAGFAGVSAGQTVTLVSAYPSDAEPGKEQREAAEELVKGRLENWKAARLAVSDAELARFYAPRSSSASGMKSSGKMAKGGDELVHVPRAEITYAGLAIHIGPQRAVTSFHEIVARPSGKIYFMREIEWRLQGKDLLIFDQRVLRKVEAEELEES